jgi:hypothetical protein
MNHYTQEANSLNVGSTPWFNLHPPKKAKKVMTSVSRNADGILIAYYLQKWHIINGTYYASKPLKS